MKTSYKILAVALTCVCVVLVARADNKPSGMTVAQPVAEATATQSMNPVTTIAPQIDAQAVSGASNAEALGGAASAVGGGGGNSSSTWNSDAWALALPGAAPAAVVSECHESQGGITVLGSGRGGKSRINQDCLAFVQCMQLVDKYAQLGGSAMALRQLELCAALTQDEIIEAEPVQSAGAVMADCLERQERIEAFAFSECGKR